MQPSIHMVLHHTTTSRHTSPLHCMLITSTQDWGIRHRRFLNRQKVNMNIPVIPTNVLNVSVLSSSSSINSLCHVLSCSALMSNRECHVIYINKVPKVLSHACISVSTKQCMTVLLGIPLPEKAITFVVGYIWCSSLLCVSCHVSRILLQ